VNPIAKGHPHKDGEYSDHCNKEHSDYTAIETQTKHGAVPYSAYPRFTPSKGLSRLEISERGIRVPYGMLVSGEFSIKFRAVSMDRRNAWQQWKKK
jgi:hypothetical protein